MLEPLASPRCWDSAIRVTGMIEGTSSASNNTGPARVWTEDEVSFASQVADQLAKAHRPCEGEAGRGAAPQARARFQQMQKLWRPRHHGRRHRARLQQPPPHHHRESRDEPRRIPGDTPARQGLEESRKASLLAAELCGQMLAYSGKGHFIIHAISLADIVREMVTLLETSIAKRASLRLSCPDEVALDHGGLGPAPPDPPQPHSERGRRRHGRQGMIRTPHRHPSANESFFEHTI